MKARAAALFLILAAPFAPASSAASLTSETSVELSATLDANNDGLPDWIIVDKATGVRQFGLQQPDGSLVWAEPDSVGLQQVTALTVGRFNVIGGSEGFAVASPTWNSVTLFADANGGGLSVPSVGIGPNVVVGFDFSGDGVDDLAIATAWDNPPAAANLSGIQIGAVELSQTYGPVPEVGVLSQGNRVQYRADAPWMMAAFRLGTNGVDFVSRPLGNFPGSQNGPDLTGFATNTAWTWGEFSTNGIGTFLFYVPGASALEVEWADEPSPFQFVWSEGTNFDLGQPVSRIITIPGIPQTELLIIFGDGSTAAVYDFDGVDAPVLRQSLTAPAGTKYSLGAVLGSGDFGLLHGPGGSLGNSTGWQHWKSDGRQYHLASSGALPALRLAQSRANVLIYSADPELSTDAPLIQSFRVGEWTDSAAPSSSTLAVTHERTRSPVLGLGDPNVSTVSGVLGLFPAVNQRSAFESSAVLIPPGNQPPMPIIFNPPPGTYPLASNAALAIQMSTPSTAPILYRTSPGLPWSIYDPNNPPAIAAQATFTAFVNGLPPSPIYTASYTVGAAPPLIPPTPSDPWSAWAKAFGLTDPNGDADGDGFTNLQECLAGTDPLDPRSAPTPTDPGTVTLLIRPPGLSAPANTLYEVAWPSATIGLTLQTTTNLADPASWSNTIGTVAQTGTEYIYYLPSSAASRQSFFRLHR